MTWIERLRYAGGEPLAIMHNAVPVDVAAAATEATWRGTGSTSCCARPGTCRGSRTRWSGREAATAAEARLLGDAARRPDAHHDPHGLGRGGRAVEYGSHVYRASRYSFELNLTC